MSGPSHESHPRHRLSGLKPDVLMAQGLVREAAESKSEHAVSYADAFCIATARRLSGTVLISDPEFHAVEHLIAVRWLTGS